MQDSQLVDAPLAMVVDDDPAIRSYVCAVAQQAGFRVDAAAEGAALLDKLVPPYPHLIVLDLNMAGRDGVQLMRDLGARRVDSRIVIFSGSDYRVLEAASDIAREHGLTISAVVQKPIKKSELLALLDRLNRESELFTAAGLRDCLDEGRVELYYQPKVALPTGRVVGCEGLLRCTDKAGRRIPPEQVISVAEGAGMIDEVTERVLRAALLQRAGWSRDGLQLSLAVNLSARTTFSQTLPEFLEHLCAQTLVPPDALTIELTESAVMDDQLLAKETMVRLRLKGFRLSIDDFGTGYSSLLRLKQLPFSEMKVDKSFVLALRRSRDNPAIVKAIIQLARNLDIRSVAEGVEDQEAMDFVVGHGCDEVQGYLIARPMPAAELPGFVRSWPGPGGSSPSFSAVGAAAV